MTASIWIFLIPLYILLALLVVLGVFALLSRIAGGKYLKPIVGFLMKLPLVGRGMRKMSQAALERQNPELASAMRKIEPHAKRMHDPVQAQKVMQKLTREERAAVLEAQDQQGGPAPEATNRQMRRQLEKQRKRR